MIIIIRYQTLYRSFVAKTVHLKQVYAIQQRWASLNM